MSSQIANQIGNPATDVCGGEIVCSQVLDSLGEVVFKHQLVHRQRKARLCNEDTDEENSGLTENQNKVLQEERPLR